MKTTIYEILIPISEQEPVTEPLSLRRTFPVSTPKPNASFHSMLLRQALLRSQVQTAIYELIHGYESSTGCSVVRLDFQANKRRVILDAIPVE